MVKGGWRQGTVLCLLFIDRRQRTVPCLPGFLCNQNSAASAALLLYQIIVRSDN